MENWVNELESAKEHFKRADHMAYVTFSLLKENRLLVKIVSELALSLRALIKAFLLYEYSFKRIQLYKDPVRNLKTFIERVAPRYVEGEDLKNIIRVLKIAKNHEKAEVEFVKKEKLVMLIGGRYETLEMDNVKALLNSVKRILSKFPEEKV